MFNETTTPQSSAVALSNHIERLHNIQKIACSLYEELYEGNDKVEQKLNELTRQEKAFDKHQISIREELEEIQQELDDATQELSITAESLSDRQSKLAKAEATLDFTRTETESLASANEAYKEELEDKRALVRIENSKLQQLQNDVDVFSEDLKSFTSETRKQQWFYGVFFVLLFSLLFFITQHVFVRAGDLIVSFDKGSIKNVWDVLISRIPFTLTVLGILTLIAEGMRRCINQIVQIHDQRLTFLRLSILAREIVDTSTHETEVSKEDLVKLRTKLKLAMLRKHMERDLGSKPTDIENEPKNVVSIKSDDEAA
ncbi:hypothetical protein [Vibrio penaeicida]|uniref:hypothetical protein n=1 Tax=Vibrio penaeicida TaxID=104609 RepID=UPI0011AB5FA3|nr:hypothetical protein [Vibrio penaeicida]